MVVVGSIRCFVAVNLSLSSSNHHHQCTCCSLRVKLGRPLRLLPSRPRLLRVNPVFYTYLAGFCENFNIEYVRVRVHPRARAYRLLPAREARMAAAAAAVATAAAAAAAADSSSCRLTASRSNATLCSAVLQVEA